MPVCIARSRTTTKKIFTGLFAFVFIVTTIFGSYPHTARATGSWLDPAWTYRNLITIDPTKVGGGTEDETNFPVEVSLSGLSNINAGGSDIRFTASDGVTPLAREIESYSGGTLVAWVKIPTLSHSANTLVYMYYGNASATEPAASSTYGSQHVWDDGGSNNDKGIWHLKETGTNPTVSDSTANANNSSGQAWSPTSSGEIDGAGSFDGSTQSVGFGGLNILPGGVGTISVWAKLTSANGNNYMLAYGGDNGEVGAWGLDVIPVDSSHLILSFLYGSPAWVQTSSLAYAPASWHLYTAVARADGTQTIYVDGTVVGTGTLPVITPASGLSLNIGVTDRAAPFQYFATGTIDEAHVSTATRSAGWVSTEYNNQSSPSSFYSVAMQETYNAAVPSAPTSLSPTFGNGQVALSWSTPSSNGGSAITDYVVQYEVTGSGLWSIFADGVSTATSATVTGLANGTSYDFEVAAVNANGQGTMSGTVTSTPKTVPGAPTGVSASPGNTQAIVSFTAPVSNGGATITSYTVTSSPGSITASGSVSPIVITGLTNGTPYTFTVTATNAAGTGSASSASGSVTPTFTPWFNTSWTSRKLITIDASKVGLGTEDETNFPVEISLTGLSGINTNGTDIRFTASDGTTQLAREIESYSSGTLVAWVKVPTLSHTTNTQIYMYYTNASATEPAASSTFGSQHVWDDGGSNFFKGIYHLPNGTTLSANDSTSDAYNGTLTNSPTATAGPIGGGANFNAASSQYVTMGNNMDITTQDMTLDTWINAPATAQNVGLIAKRVNGSPFSQYQFMIGSVDGSGNGVSSKKIGFFGFDGTHLQGVHTSADVVDGNWHQVAVTRTSSGFVMYVDGVSASMVTDTAGVSSESYTNTAPFDLATNNNGSVFYNGKMDEARVSIGKARSAGYISTEYKNESSPSTFYTGSTTETIAVPAAPTSLSGTRGNAQVPLTWSAPSNGGSPITDYVIQYEVTGSGSWSVFSDGTSTATSATVTGLTNGTSYDFEVAAVNAVGQGSFSSTATATPATSPGAPTIVSATPGNNQAVVSFTTPSNGGYAITSYTVTSSPGGFTGTGSNSPIIVSGLTNGTAYTFTVTATTSYGTGSASSASGSVTPSLVSWFNTGWAHRNQITLDASKVGNGSEDESNFPVEVSLTGLSGINSNGGDIRFTASDGTTQLAREIESYSSSTGTLVAWVKIPTISHTTNTAIYMYYGNSSATEPAANSTYGSQAVWSNSYADVYHLPNGTTLSANDSTSNVANGTLVASPTATTGQIGGGALLNGSTQYVTASDAAVPTGNSAFTMSTWFKTTTNYGNASYAGLVGYGTASATNATVIDIGQFNQIAISQYGAAFFSGGSYNDGQWHYVAATQTGNAWKMYIDGNYISAGSGTMTTNVTHSQLMIGKAAGAASLGGSIDETHVSSVVRSAGWIATEYGSQSSPSTFSAFATEETLAPPGAPTSLGATPGNAQVALSWTAPASSGRTPITDYVIQYEVTGSGSWSVFSDGTSTATSATVTGLTNGTSYDFEIAAVNSDGTGSYSSTATATPVTTPGAPTGVSATPGNAQAIVSFTAPASTGGSVITGYTVTSNPGGFTGTGSASPITVTGLTNGTAYTFTVTATNILGTGPASSPSSAVTPATLPGTPTALGTTFGNTQVALSWSAPVFDGGSAITDYAVQYEVTGSGSWSTFSDGVSSATTATVTGLTNGTSYDFQVAAINSVGPGSYSSTATATPMTVPGAPIIGTATRGNTQAVVTFMAPVSDGGSTITSYTVTASSGGFTGTGSGSPITVTGLTNGTAYTFTVTATNTVGTGAASAASNSVTPATVPNAPTIGTATAGNAQATVTFTAPTSDGGSAITSYTVTASPGGFTVSGSASPLTVTGLTNGTAYTFTVTATNDVGTSSASSASNSATPVTVPDAPTVGTATGGNAQATVTFTAPDTDGGSPITSYTVTSSPGGLFASDTASPITVTGLTNGTAYTFKVTATNVVGTGAASASSNSVTPATTPGAPTSLTPTSGNAQVALSWTAPSDTGGAAISDYIVEYKLDSDSSWSTFSDGVSTATSATVTGLTNGSLYDFRVSAANSVGQGSASTQATSTPMTVPDAPVIGTATGGNAQATVTFTAPDTDGGTSITSYTVTSSPGGFFATGTASPLTVTGLTNGTSYTFTVTATNAVGTGAASASSNSVIPATLPGAPTAVSAVPGNTQATISFTPPASDGGNSISSYTVTSSPGGFTGTGSASPITVTGLTNGTSYTFTVTATNDVGTGSASSPSNSVTLSTEPGAPGNLAATVEESSIGLSWSAPISDGGSPITDYIVEYQLTTGGSWAVFADGSSTATTATVTGLADSTSYDFRIRAVNEIGESLPSGTATATPGEPAQVLVQSFSDLTVPSIGTNVRITNEGSVQYEYAYTWCVTVASTDPCGSDVDVFSSSAAKLIQPGDNFDTTLVSTVPTPGNYWFTITAVYGSTSSTSTQSFTALATYPDAPTSVSAVAGNAQAVVSFTPPASNGGSTITGYTVTSGPGGLTITGAGSPLTVTGLTNGTAYTFTVTATNSIGTSPASAPSAPVTPATIPDAPQALSAIAGNHQVALSWLPPDTDGGSPITDYVVEYKLDSDSSWSIFSDGISTATAATITGLTNNLTYDFEVNSVNALGQSAASTGNATLPADIVIHSTGGGGGGGGHGTQYYVVSASAGVGGSISPSGSVALSQGANQAFVIIPNQGYEITALFVDGSSLGPIATYTVSGIAANHTVAASFAPVGTTQTTTDQSPTTPESPIASSQVSNTTPTIPSQPGTPETSTTVSGSGTPPSQVVSTPREVTIPKTPKPQPTAVKSASGTSPWLAIVACIVLGSSLISLLVFIILRRRRGLLM